MKNPDLSHKKSELQVYNLGSIAHVLDRIIAINCVNIFKFFCLFSRHSFAEDDFLGGEICSRAQRTPRIDLVEGQIYGVAIRC